MEIRRIGIVMGALLLIVAFMWIRHHEMEAVKYSSASIYNKHAKGISVLAEWYPAIKKDSLHYKESAILSSSEIERYRAFFILDPMATISQRESEYVKNYVVQGNLLYLTITMPSAFANIANLVRTFDLPIKITESDTFNNHQPSYVTGKSGVPPFKKGETYAVYSNYEFERKECVAAGWECFIAIRKIGEGRVIFQLGYPLFSNGLIQLKDNRRAAFRMVQKFSPVLVDEYHHFFSDMNFTDLLWDLKYGVPLIGIFLLVILYFLFAHTKFHRDSLIPKPEARKRSFHQLHENFSLGLLDQSGTFSTALRQHVAFLKRVDAELGKQSERAVASYLNSEASYRRDEFLKAANGLAGVHRKWLTEKGRFRT